MTLKMDRQVLDTEISYFMNETASPGAVVSISTAGSGISLDNTSSVATVSASSSGAKPLGVLLNEVVNLDLTRTPVNWHKDQVNQGDKVTILRKGWVITDQVTLANAGSGAVLSSSGNVTNQGPISIYNQVANPKVGSFLSNKDENGFAKLYVDLP